MLVRFLWTGISRHNMRKTVGGPTVIYVRYNTTYTTTRHTAIHYALPPSFDSFRRACFAAGLLQDSGISSFELQGSGPPRLRCRVSPPSVFSRSMERRIANLACYVGRFLPWRTLSGALPYCPAQPHFPIVSPLRPLAPRCRRTSSHLYGVPLHHDQTPSIPFICCLISHLVN